MSDGTTPPHKRRRRYAGTHPRAFADKYKELQPERYKDEAERVIARGDTPVGTHRPIMVGEILQVLAPKPGDIAVDATLGYGGHASALLEAIIPGGRLYAMDRDPIELPKTVARLRSEGYNSNTFQAHCLNYSDLPQMLSDEGLAGIDLFLADLGLSSMQIDDPSRGFTFKRSGPLDMRMNPHLGTSANELLKHISEDNLRYLLENYADESESLPIARAISRHRGTIGTTRALADAIREAFPGLPRNDPIVVKALRRVFQAIRIEVNGEFTALDALLVALPYSLHKGARAAFLTFHSGEDKRVEKAFAAGFASGIYAEISQSALRSDRTERYANPRSSAAKLRWARKS